MVDEVAHPEPPRHSGRAEPLTAATTAARRDRLPLASGGMRLDKPRLPPLPESDWDPEIADRIRAMGPNPPNIIKTLAHHPKLYKRWSVFGNYIFGNSSLPPRHRELAMLRIGWRCRSAYEFGQHTLIGLECGLNETEIAALTRPIPGSEWSEFERFLITAVDELKDDSFISEATWAELSKEYSTQQLMDLVFTVGQYALVSMALNTLGVQLDDGVPGFPRDAG